MRRILERCQAITSTCIHCSLVQSVYLFTMYSCLNRDNRAGCRNEDHAGRCRRWQMSHYLAYDREIDIEGAFFKYRWLKLATKCACSICLCLSLSLLSLSLFLSISSLFLSHILLSLGPPFTFYFSRTLTFLSHFLSVGLSLSLSLSVSS